MYLGTAQEKVSRFQVLGELMLYRFGRVCSARGVLQRAHYKDVLVVNTCGEVQ